MRIYYISPPDGTPITTAPHALVSPAPDTAQSDVIVDWSGPRRSKLPETLARLRPGDVLVLDTLSAVASSALHLVQVMARVFEKSAWVEVRDVSEAGSPHAPRLYGPAEMLVFAELARFEQSRRGTRRAFARGQRSRHKLSAEQTARAIVLMADPDLTMQQVADEIGCSIPTLYRVKARAEVTEIHTQTTGETNGA